MIRVILGLFEGEAPKGASLSTTWSDNYACEVEVQETLGSGGRIYSGRAASVEGVEEKVAEIDTGAETLREKKETRYVTKTTEFLADFDAGFVGVDSSDGDFFWHRVAADVGGWIERAEIDLDAVADHILSEADGDVDVWQTGWARDEDEDGTPRDVGTAFHQSASQKDVRDGGLNMLGFGYTREGDAIRGVIAESGYLALFAGPTRAEEAAEWIRSTVLPHAQIPEEEGDTQSTLPGNESEETEADA